MIILLHYSGPSLPQLYPYKKPKILYAPDSKNGPPVSRPPESVSADSFPDAVDEKYSDGNYQSHCFLNEKELRKNIRLFKEKFSNGDNQMEVIYAMKANSNPRILELMIEEGLDGFDCASEGEIAKALAVRTVTEDQIYFNNPAKAPEEVRFARDLGVTYYTIQSRSGLRRVFEEYNEDELSTLDVSVRVHTSNADAVIGLSSKYGCTPTEAAKLVKDIRDAGARPGLTMHVGSQNENPRSFVDSLKVLKRVAKRSGGVETVDLGGGIPVNYFDSDNFDTAEYLEVIRDTVKQMSPDLFKQYEEESRIILEPGRALVAGAVDLVIPIVEIDDNLGKKIRRVHFKDGVFTSFSDSTVHGWRYNIKSIMRDGRPMDPEAEFVVFGQTCDSGDTLGRLHLPENIGEGDLVWVPNAGAYMDSQAANFCGFNPPEYVSYNI